MRANFKKDTAIIDVATGEVKAAQAPAHLQCLALGSCVAVILYDEERKIGGIAHVMLPSSIHGDTEEKDLLKHANHAIYELVKQMRGLGAGEEVLTARIAGGALVVLDTSEIGKANIKAVRNILQELNIRITDEHLGGNAGRSVLFDVATGELQINGRIVRIETTKPSLAEEKKELKEKSSEYIIGLEKKLAEQTKNFSERAEELEDAEKAALNLLEDLTKEREDLQISKAKSEAILLSIGDGLVVVDKEGKILVVNKMFKNLVGWKGEEVIGKSMVEVVPREDEAGNIVPFKERILTKVLSTTATITTATTWYYIRKDKTRFLAASIITPFILEGKIIGAVEVFRDITKEKEVDRAKTEFISIASHQLRTPVSALSWVIEALQSGDQNFTPKQQEYVNDLSNTTKRLIELVEDLLDFSRIQLKTPAVTEEHKIEISGFIEEFIKKMETYAASKKHSIILKNEIAEPLIMEVNTKMLYNVLQNILSNAIDYSPENTAVTVVLEKVKDYLQVSISNKGPAIPKIDQPHMFEKFYRAESAKKMKIIGTGLGLYVAKAIIEEVGGKIGFESEEGKDTVFWFTVPLPLKVTNKS